MQLKKALLATSALALLGATEAQAAGDLYLSVFGGANFSQDASNAFFGGKNNFTSQVTFDPETGFTLGAAIGTPLDNWIKGLRGELEVSYRRNDVGGGWRTSTYQNSTNFRTGSGVVDANVSNFAIMANLWYDINVGHKIRPYLGGGIGWARSRMDGALFGTVLRSSDGTTTYTRTTTFSLEQSGFIFQLGLGFNYEVAPGVDVGLGYRYVEGENFNFGGEGSFDLPGFENANHAVQASITVEMN